MEYALLTLNDELTINLEGIGLIPLVSFYPDLWELYIKRLNLNQEYLIETLKGMKREKNKSDLLLNKINLINNQIKTLTSFYGTIPVCKIGENGKYIFCKSLTTDEEILVDKRVFKNHVVSEIEVRRDLNIKNKLERRKI